jgi:hypothetical protein
LAAWAMLVAKRTTATVDSSRCLILIFMREYFFGGGKELRAMFLRHGAALRISMVRSMNSSNLGLLNRVLAQTEITFPSQ